MKKRSITIAALMLSVSMVAGMTGGCGATKEPPVDPTPWTDEDNQNTGDEVQTGADVVDDTNQQESEQPDTQADDTQEVVIPEISSSESVVDYDSVVVVGNAGYELYTYREDTATSYADTVNSVAADLSGT